MADEPKEMESEEGDTPKHEDEELLAEAKKLWELAESAEADMREQAEDDMRFVSGDQWPQHIEEERQRDGRPCLVINRMPAFARQVINDARQNKPGIIVHPADSSADPATAEVMGGLIRNIEYTSNADVAYDTGVECAVKGGFGYWRVVIAEAYYGAPEVDVLIKRVANPFSVFGDPNSMEADSSDWMDAFVVERLSERQWKAKYGKKAKVSWSDTDAWGGVPWRDDDSAMILEWWHREEVDVTFVQVKDVRTQGVLTMTSDDVAKPETAALIDAGVLVVLKEYEGSTYKVTQRILSGAEILETVDWPGCYIPIVPVYGDEFNIKGERHFRSLIHDAKDAQRMFNYWRTTGTELVALAPRNPWIGKKGQFDEDPNWQTANSVSHPYLEYTGDQPPQRQPLGSGPAAGALQEALNASDDMKAILGLYDASLGARSNETSGRAILARQREGDVSTFHFIDNLNRAIRHTGRILIDVIPKVYSVGRVIRVLGEDGTPQKVPLGQPYQAQDDRGQAIQRMHDFNVGRYDLTVKSGPSFTTRREEAAYQMTEMIRALPAAAPVIGPELVKNLDFPGADKIAKRLEEMQSGQVPDKIKKILEDGKKRIQQLEQENARLKTDQQGKMQAAKIDAAVQQQTARIEAETDIVIAQLQAAVKERIAAMQMMARPQQVPVQPNGQAA